MTSAEIAFTFPCQGSELVGILHPGAEAAARGVLIVVGGPQYRVGSHRQFVLLARELAKAGVCALRFDYRGMGDAEGESVGFENIDADIAAALDAWFVRNPRLREVVIWGLCDAASAALFYAWRDPRIKALVLLNPWVRSETGLARTYLKHYYLARLASPGLWRKVYQGKFDFPAALRSLLSLMAKALGKTGALTKPSPELFKNATVPLAERMAQGLKRFTGPVLIILSGDDLTAAEFKDMVQGSQIWRQLLSQPQVTRYDLPEANHTFSCQEWRDRVAAWTIQWVKSW